MPNVLGIAPVMLKELATGVLDIWEERSLIKGIHELGPNIFENEAHFQNHKVDKQTDHDLRTSKDLQVVEGLPKPTTPQKQQLSEAMRLSRGLQTMLGVGGSVRQAWDSEGDPLHRMPA